MKHIGIDPGANGGIAVLDDSGAVIFFSKMPATPQDLIDCLSEFANDSVCTLERVQGMPKQGGSAMFNFGKGFGYIEMALIALKIPTETITPQKWEKTYQLGASRDCTKTEWKNKLKAKAQQMFPYIKMTLAICDALLIAEYGRRNRK